jgi:hypothetical protein
LGNDSRCSESTEQRCQKLAEEGSDCKWRAAFSVTGSLSMTTSDVKGLISKPGANMAVAKGISNVTGVPTDYIDVDLAAPEAKLRRLRALAQSNTLPLAGGVVTVTYVISVSGDAPATVNVTGLDVGNQLAAAKSGDAITSVVDKSLGAGTFALSVKSVDVSEVVIRNDAQSSTSLTSRLASTTSEATSLRSTTSAKTTTTTVSSVQDMPLPETMDGAPLTSCRLPLLVTLTMVLYSLL